MVAAEGRGNENPKYAIVEPELVAQNPVDGRGGRAR